MGFLLSRILCQYNEVWDTYEVTAYLALGVFSVFTSIQYFSAQRMLSFKNKGAFIGLVMGATLIKMILSFVVLGIYAKINKPSSNYFIVPFFVIYFLFTIYETWMMTVISNSTKHE